MYKTLGLGQRVGKSALRLNHTQRPSLGWGNTALAVPLGDDAPELLQQARALLSSEPNFRLRVGQSRIPDGGLGVFVDQAETGAVAKGRVVALCACTGHQRT